MATFTRDDVELYFEDHGGDGRPVVLVHGWPLSGEAWGEQVDPLRAAGHRVVTYDRRGFGRSSKPAEGYDYDTMAADLEGLLAHLDLSDAVVVGFSMGGGEVARYIGNHGTDRLAGAVFASAVPPYLEATDDNPAGPLDDEAITEMQDGLRDDRTGFFTGFVTDFFSVDDELLVTEQQRDDAVALCLQSDQDAAVACIDAFSRSDFRDDLQADDVPTLVIHGDGDAIVPLEASGQRTAEAVPGATLHVVAGGPHGINVSHAEEFNTTLLEWLATL